MSGAVLERPRRPRVATSSTTAKTTSSPARPDGLTRRIDRLTSLRATSRACGCDKCLAAIVAIDERLRLLRARG